MVQHNDLFTPPPGDLSAQILDRLFGSGWAGPGRPKLYESPAERQKAYRERCKQGSAGKSLQTNDPGQGAVRLDLQVPWGTRHTLRLLSAHAGDPDLATTLIDLIDAAEVAVVRKMDADEFEEYLDGV